MSVEEFSSDSVGGIMSKKIPTCGLSATKERILENIAGDWDSTEQIYVVSEGVLKGVLNLQRVLKAEESETASMMMEKVETSLKPGKDREKAVFLSLKRNIVNIPVTDEKGRFLGVVTPQKIIEIMHKEHMEDVLLTAGISGKNSSVKKIMSSTISSVVSDRAPWLLFGLMMGIGLAVISSFFEPTLQKTVSLAFFLPVVTYIADSVGTQTEAITVRALAVTDVNYRMHIFREFLVGNIIGSMTGVIGGVGSILITGSLKIGLVVSLSLFFSTGVSTVLASIIPISFTHFNLDPAVGSGPLATVIQDVISVVIYFILAVIIL